MFLVKKRIALLVAGIVSVGFCFSQSSVWKVSKGENTLYLAGSIHFLRPSDYPLPLEYETAFEKSDKLILETDLGEMSTPATVKKMMAKAIFTDTTTLQSVLAPETYKLLTEKAEQYSLPMERLKKFKPSMAISILSVGQLQQLGFSPEGVDAYYFSKAKEAGKKIEFLETVDYQISVLFGMGEGYENEFVLYSLKDLENTEKDLHFLVTDWRRGTSDETEKQMKATKEAFPTVYNSLLIERNDNWFTKIESYLTDEPIEFMVVGLAHLYGPDGLLKKLQGKGYTIEQVK